MMKWFFRRSIERFERTWHYDAAYLKEIVDLSPWAAWKFSLAAGLGTFRRDVPKAALFAAGVTAVRLEDCGPCTQLGISMAEKQGVPPDVLRAVMTDDVAAMPDDVALAWRFTRATVAHDPAADTLREEVVRRWGRRAVVTLAFAITAGRIYPTVKYAMGHGRICARVVVDGQPVVVARGPATIRRLSGGPSEATRAS
jgi:hypothetical protein